MRDFKPKLYYWMFSDVQDSEKSWFVDKDHVTLLVGLFAIRQGADKWNIKIIDRVKSVTGSR